MVVLLYSYDFSTSLIQALFQNATMWLRDTGVLNKLRSDVLKPVFPIPDPKVRHNQPLNNWQLGIVMIISLVGSVISILTFMVELLKAKKTKSLPEMATEENAIRIAEYSRANRAKHETHNATNDHFPEVVDGNKPSTQIFVSLID